MTELRFVPVTTDEQIVALARLASEIWHQHFIPIIGEAQVEYMVEKFQSYPALKEQLKNGYEYFQIMNDDTFSGYIGVHEENGELFLSKLYISRENRGQHLATYAFEFLKDICRSRGLSKIWLTCNKYNDNTLAIYDHLGFSITRSQVADIGSGFVMDDFILEYIIT